MEIIIKFATIFERVDIETAYIGAKSLTEPTDYGRMRTLKADRELLRVFIDDAVGELTSESGRQLNEVKADANGLAHTLDIRPGLAPGVEMLLLHFYTDYVLQRWYMILGLDVEAARIRERKQAALGTFANEITEPDEPVAPGKIASPRRYSIF